jgi:hypothetical protein
MGMSSELQIEANRRNAQRSTGPRTTGGRSRVASNALKHGLSGGQIVLPGEDPAEFDLFRSDLISDLVPQGALEEVLVEKIVADAWRLRRVPQLEAALYWREKRQNALSAASAEVSSCETSFVQRAEESSNALHKSEVREDRREAHQAAVAKLQALRAEPVSPLVALTSTLETVLTTLSNLERYETTLYRSLTKALHELQRFQAIRAGERVSAPVALDVDVNINGNGVVNPE